MNVSGFATRASALPLWLSAAVLLAAGCGGAGGADSATVGEVSSARGSKDRPTVAARAPALPVRPPRGETLGARVTKPVALRAHPSAGARVLARVAKRTRFHSPSVMAVLRQQGRWLGVTSEHLPNGRVGWVRREGLQLLREQWSIRVDLSRRRATLRFKGRPYRSFPVAVGAPATPTPPGTYGVTDRLSTGGPGSPYGCCVLALTGHQTDIPQDWPGGDRLAIHGTSAPASIGQAASHGCLRASERSMRLLLAKVPLGAQVVVRR